MKKNLLLIITIFIVHFAQAQIVVTNVNFPAIGDTLKTATDGAPEGIVIGAPGSDLVWDFSALNGPTGQIIIQDTTGGSESDQFPNANARAVLNAGEAYYSITEDSYSLLGVAGGGNIGLDLDIVARYSPPIIERRSPMEFFDINNVDYALNVDFGLDDLPTELLDSFPLLPDSFRLSLVSERFDVVDGWGTLTIPGGTYEVLREKRREERETRLEVKIGIGPFSIWQDITQLIPAFDQFLGLDTIVTYNFYSNDAKEEIAVVTVDPIDEVTVTSVTYKSLDDVTTNVEYVNRGNADIIAYPNPAIDVVKFDFVNLDAGLYDLKIYNILGSVVYEDQEYISSDRTLKVDLSFLRKGTYLYNLSDQKGNSIATKRLIVLRP